MLRKTLKTFAEYLSSVMIYFFRNCSVIFNKYYLTFCMFFYLWQPLWIRLLVFTHLHYLKCDSDVDTKRLHVVVLCFLCLSVQYWVYSWSHDALIYYFLSSSLPSLLCVLSFFLSFRGSSSIRSSLRGHTMRRKEVEGRRIARTSPSSIPLTTTLRIMASSSPWCSW